MSIAAAPGVTVQDRYQLVEPIADYGLGATWKAKDTAGRGQLVAVKFLRPIASAPDALPDALERHLVALRSLRHGNVLPTLDHGLFGATPYVVHPTFGSASLASGLAVASGDAAPPELLERFLDRILAALTAAAEARTPLLHGAIDPRSVRIARIGAQNFELRVLDFGLSPYASWAEEAATPHTLTLRRAPERGPGDAPTVASEVFAVGELLRVMFGAAPAFDRPAEGVPIGVWGAVRNATAESPRARYPDVSTLATDLRRLWKTPLAPKPDEAPAPTSLSPSAPVDIDATFVVPNPRGSLKGARASEAPPPVASFPERVAARGPRPPEDDMTVRVLPKLPKPAPTGEEDTTVRVNRMTHRRSPWDAAPPTGDGSVGPPRLPTPWDTAVRQKEVSLPPPAAKASAAPPREVKAAEVAAPGKSEAELREERRLRVLLGVVAAVVVALAATLLWVATTR